MFNVLILLITSAGVGYMLRRNSGLRKTLSRTTPVTIFILLFMFGLSIGSNESILSNIHKGISRVVSRNNTRNKRTYPYFYLLFVEATASPFGDVWLSFSVTLRCCAGYTFLPAFLTLLSNYLFNQTSTQTGIGYFPGKEFF